MRYRFAHAFFRQTLYEEMIAPRRMRLHQQVARALEARYARRLDEHAAELAEHFAHSTDPADLAKAVELRRAGRAARDGGLRLRRGGAALEQALDVQEVLDPDDVARACELRLQLAWARQREGNEVEARRLAFEVAETARAARVVEVVAGAAELLGAADIPRFHPR